eukprot:g83.t1
MQKVPSLQVDDAGLTADEGRPSLESHCKGGTNGGPSTSTLSTPSSVPPFSRVASDPSSVATCTPDYSSCAKLMLLSPVQTEGSLARPAGGAQPPQTSGGQFSEQGAPSERNISTGIMNPVHEIAKRVRAGAVLGTGSSARETRPGTPTPFGGALMSFAAAASSATPKFAPVCRRCGEASAAEREKFSLAVSVLGPDGKQRFSFKETGVTKCTAHTVIRHAEERLLALWGWQDVDRDAFADYMRLVRKPLPVEPLASPAGAASSGGAASSSRPASSVSRAEGTEADAALRSLAAKMAGLQVEDQRQPAAERQRTPGTPGQFAERGSFAAMRTPSGPGSRAASPAADANQTTEERVEKWDLVMQFNLPVPARIAKKFTPKVPRGNRKLIEMGLRMAANEHLWDEPDVVFEKEPGGPTY